MSGNEQATIGSVGCMRRDAGALAQVIYETCSALDLVAMVFDPEERIRELERQLTKYERKG
jgi:hypothetical protein